MIYLNRRIMIMLLMLMGAVSHGRAGDQHDIVENYTILTNLADSVSKELVAHIVTDSDTFIIIKAVGSRNEREWFLESRLIRAFIHQQFRVSVVESTNQISAEMAGITCEYQIQQFQIQYETTGGFFRRTGAKRHFSIQIGFQLTQNQNQHIIWSGTVSKEYHDEIPYGMIKDVERPELDFTHAQLPRTLGLREVIDFLLFVGATGAVIYSFYVFRSN